MITLLNQQQHYQIFNCRPVGGYINFCPVSITNQQSDDYLLTLAKHELLHALVRKREISSYYSICYNNYQIIITITGINLNSHF